MAAPVSVEIEKEFARLSPDAQLSLLERLIHRIRLAMADHEEAFNKDLSAMAADPEIQREIHQIKADFTATERDGLEGD